MATYRDFFWTRGKEAFIEYFNDFHQQVLADWTITKVGTGTNVIGNLAGGQLVITNSAADNDYVAYQLASETFKFVKGKKLQFVAIFSTPEVVQSDIMIGLHILDTNPFSTEPAHGIYFRKDDGDALLDCIVVKGGTASTLVGQSGVSSLTNSKSHRVEFYYDGQDEIDFYLDQVRIGSLPITNAPDTEEISVSFVIQNGEAVAKSMNVDMVLARQER